MKTLLVILICTSFSALAQTDEKGFEAGVKAYQAKEFEKAQDLFVPLVQEHPGNPVLLYNLGLAEYQLGNIGMALGLWRKARSLDHDFGEVDAAIEFTTEKLFPERDQGFLYTFYQWLLKVPMTLWIMMSLFFFFLIGWFAIEYGAKRKKPLNEWPLWLYAAVPLFLFATVLSIHLALLKSQPKATVIQKNQLTHTNPSETSPTLNELVEGEVVWVENTHGRWAQVRTLTGIPGWIPQESLILFEGL